jgi:hypothetical protein
MAVAVVASAIPLASKSFHQKKSFARGVTYPAPVDAHYNSIASQIIEGTLTPIPGTESQPSPRFSLVIPIGSRSSDAPPIFHRPRTFPAIMAHRMEYLSFF